jgi:hypothetical protein
MASQQARRFLDRMHEIVWQDMGLTPRPRSAEDVEMAGRDLGFTMPERPLLGTLPTGRVNVMTLLVPRAGASSRDRPTGVRVPRVGVDDRADTGSVIIQVSKPSDQEGSRVRCLSFPDPCRVGQVGSAPSGQHV